MNRCVEAGRSPSLCQGNALLGHFVNGVGAILGADTKPPAPGPELGGAFQARTGNWRVEFDDNFATTSCGDLAPEPRTYSLELKNNGALITIKNPPKPIVLAVRSDAGDANMQQNGQYYDRTTTNSTTSYQANTGYVAPSVQYAPKTETCAQPILSSKGAGGTTLDQASAVTIGLVTNGQERAPEKPAGVRMHGLYGAPTGFSVEFFPESAIIGCGPAAHAYPYAVQPSGGQPSIRIDAPGFPITSP